MSLFIIEMKRGMRLKMGRSANRANLMVTADDNFPYRAVESAKSLHLKIEDQPNQIKVV